MLFPDDENPSIAIVIFFSIIVDNLWCKISKILAEMIVKAE